MDKDVAIGESDKRYAACKSCGYRSYDRPFREGGYCKRCKNLIDLRRVVKRWNRSNRTTLKKGIPKGYGGHEFITDDLSYEEFQIWRNEHIDQIESALTWLKACESRRRGNVTAGEIEDQLRRILFYVNPKATFPRLTTVISNEFTKDQLGMIYNVLDIIEEEIPWKPINRRKIWHKISEYRLRDTG